MRKKFEVTLTLLNALDDNRPTLVSYYNKTREVIMYQHGGKIVRFTHLAGFLIPIKHTVLLYPNDLASIKNILTYITESEYPILVAPIKCGYQIYAKGDTTYTSAPKKLSTVRFYSIKSRLAIQIAKWTSEEVKYLFRLLAPKE